MLKQCRFESGTSIVIMWCIRVHRRPNMLVVTMHVTIGVLCCRLYHITMKCHVYMFSFCHNNTQANLAIRHYKYEQCHAGGPS